MEKEKVERNIYFKDLDGLRATALIFILFFHSRFPCFKTLWIGVPVFFVISGFLITRLLVENKNAPDYLKVFYTRRILRIFPIYYLLLLISILWGCLVKADLGQLPFFLTYLQNFTISANVQPEYCNGLINHTWSLSVEEIFYLFWPLVILISKPRTLNFALISIGILSLVYKVVIISFFHNASSDRLIMLSLAGNLDGLMAGALLGVLSLRKGFLTQPVFPIKQFLFVLLLFTGSLVANYQVYTYLKFYSIFKALLSFTSVLLTFYLILALITEAKATTWLHKLFTTRFMNYTGKISYGLYLYHPVVFGLTEAIVFHFKIGLDPLLLFAAQVMLSYLAAIISWNFIERPILKYKNKIRYSVKT